MRSWWQEAPEPSRWRAAALLPIGAAGWLYGCGARAHRALYRVGALRAARFAGHVISVGSLAVGGTGKTPLAAWVAAHLHRRGRKVALASRGYGRRGGAALVVVSDGRFVRSRAEEAGDEPMLLAAHAPGVPVLVGRDRARVARRALATFGADVLVLDDGFQHHRLHRDLDLVTLDGDLGLGNRRVLPRGPLREPLGALRYAHAVGVVDGPLSDEDEARVTRTAPLAYRFAARRRPVGLRPHAGGDAEPPASLDGAEVGLLAGIARPVSFRRTLEALGARVVAERLFRDHHRYRAGDLRGLAREAPLWVTTEKDAVKIPPSWTAGADLRVLRIELELEGVPAFLDWIETRLR